MFDLQKARQPRFSCSVSSFKFCFWTPSMFRAVVDLSSVAAQDWQIRQTATTIRTVLFCMATQALISKCQELGSFIARFYHPKVSRPETLLSGSCGFRFRVWQHVCLSYTLSGRCLLFRPKKIRSSSAPKERPDNGLYLARPLQVQSHSYRYSIFGRSCLNMEILASASSFTSFFRQLIADFYIVRGARKTTRC